MQYNLFEYIPDNFFRILDGENRFINSKIIFTLFLKMKENNSYTIEKDIMLDIMEDYFNQINFNEEYEDEGQILTNSREKSTSLYRRLKECGWIDDEYGHDQKIIVNFFDYTIRILNTLLELEKSNSFALSSKVYNIYTNLKNIEIDRGYLILSTIHEESKDLIDRLRALNSNIKKYIKRIINLENKDDNEYLTTILNELLGEYKEKVIDEAYFYMKTKDNPRRYRRDFNERLDAINNNKEQKDNIVKQIMENDNLSELDATIKFEDIISYLSTIFDECLYLMDDIDKKNKTYISTSIDKINIILNNNKDIEGMLLNILKNFKEHNLEIDFPNRKPLNESSLYMSRAKRQITQNSIIEEEKNVIDKEAIIKIISDKTKYSKINIFKYIENKFNNKTALTIDDFYLQDEEELIKLLLIIVYSKEIDCKYEIDFSKEYITKNGFKINKFEVRRKTV